MANDTRQAGVSGGMTLTIGVSLIMGTLLIGWAIAQLDKPAQAQGPSMQQQLAEQTRLLERILTILERWETHDKAAKAATEAPRWRRMEDWQPGNTEGLKELPKTFGGSR